MDQPQGHFISGRTPLAFNDDLTYGLCHPAEFDPAFFANNDADELFFLAQGEIDIQTLFGKLKLVPGDYLIIPRSCPYRFSFSSPPKLIYVEAKQNLSIPDDFMNVHGQLKMDAPYSERSFKCPEWDTELMESDEPVSIVRKRQGAFTHTFYSTKLFQNDWLGRVCLSLCTQLEKHSTQNWQGTLASGFPFDICRRRVRGHELSPSGVGLR